MKDNNWVLLKNFPTFLEAEMMCEILEKSGIKCSVQRGSLSAATEFLSTSGDGDLFCFENDAKKALEILKAYIDLSE